MANLYCRHAGSRHEIHLRPARPDDRSLAPASDADGPGIGGRLPGCGPLRSRLGLHQALRRAARGRTAQGQRRAGRRRHRLPARQQRHGGQAPRDRAGLPGRGGGDRHGHQHRQGPERRLGLRRRRHQGRVRRGAPTRCKGEGHLRKRLSDERGRGSKRRRLQAQALPDRRARRGGLGENLDWLRLRQGRRRPVLLPGRDRA